MATTCPSCGKKLSKAGKFCPFCGSSTIHPKKTDPYIGRVFSGKYRADKLLGTGGMGAVYLGTQLNLDQPVAIKILHAHFSCNSKIVTRFENEAKAYTKITHPNTIMIHDFGTTEDGILYLVMEYVHGRTLHELISNKLEAGVPIDMPSALTIAIQICDALAAAHTRGIIHRDLKPQNVMILEPNPGKYFAKILDFGIAKIRDEDISLTATGAVMGTPEFMSPEQAQGESVDHRTDIYALGIILYLMVTSQLPFTGHSALSILQKHVTERPKSPSQILKDHPIPQLLEDAIMRALAKDKETRYERIEDLQRDLEVVRDLIVTGTFEAASAPPPDEGAIDDASPKGKGWIVAMMAIVIVLGLAVGGYFVVPRLLGGTTVADTTGSMGAPLTQGLEQVAIPTPPVTPTTPDVVADPDTTGQEVTTTATPAPTATNLMYVSLKSDVEAAFKKADFFSLSEKCAELDKRFPGDDYLTRCDELEATALTLIGLKSTLDSIDDKTKKKRCKKVKAALAEIAKLHESFADTLEDDHKECFVTTKKVKKPTPEDEIVPSILY